MLQVVAIFPNKRIMSIFLGKEVSGTDTILFSTYKPKPYFFP